MQKQIVNKCWGGKKDGPDHIKCEPINFYPIQLYDHIKQSAVPDIASVILNQWVLYFK